MTQTKTWQKSCIINVETGGLEQKHPTIQIAAMVFNDISYETIEEIEVKLEFDEADCYPQALRMTSFDKAVWKSEAVTQEVARVTLEAFFLKHQTYELISKTSGLPYKTVRLLAHNAPFNVSRLRALWGNDFTPFCWRYPLDTLQLSLWYFSKTQATSRPENFQLRTLCRFFKIDTPDTLDAFTECQLTLELLRKLRPPGMGPVW